MYPEIVAMDYSYNLRALLEILTAKELPTIDVDATMSILIDTASRGPNNAYFGELAEEMVFGVLLTDSPETIPEDIGMMLISNILLALSELSYFLASIKLSPLENPRYEYGWIQGSMVFLRRVQ